MALAALLALIPVGKLAGFVIDLGAQPVKEWLNDQNTRRSFEQAIRHACRTFDARHPELGDLFFDESFVRHHIAPLLAEFLSNRGRLPSAEQIVTVWAATYQRDPRAIDDMAPYAAELLKEIARQVAAQTALQAYLDRAAWDEMRDVLTSVQQLTRVLADQGRRDALEEALDLLWKAAVALEGMAEMVIAGERGIEFKETRMQYRYCYGSARRRLERMQYIAAVSLLADFGEFVKSPYDAIQDTYLGGSGAEPDFTALQNGVTEFDVSLRNAP